VSVSGKYDVAIVGGGIAGLTSGVRLAERGVRVVVLEKGESERYPCNTRYSGGAFHLCFHRVYEDEAALTEVIHQRTQGAARPDIARAVARDTRTAVDWLKSKGVRFIKGGPDAWRESTLAPPLVAKPGLHWEGRGGDVLLRTLDAAFTKANGTILRGARARCVRMDGDRCVGVEFDQQGKAVSLDAGTVMLCDGGFQANHDLLREFITKAPEKLKQRNAETGTGDGIRMAREIGAQLVGMDKFYGHLLAQDAMHNDALWPFPMVDHICIAAIVVDGAAHRFVDEGLGGVYIANQVAHLEDPLSAVVIFDERIWNGPAREFILPANPNLVTAGANILRAESLTSLGGQLGLPAGALEDTVAEYNNALQADGAASLSPPRTTGSHKAYPISQGPFYALRLVGGITFTMGGIATDDVGRVLNEQNAIIPGLYAAGCTTGGLEGGPYAGYVGGLAKSAAMALRASDHIAASRL
jgi:fumarate reductase flavoprotein subunit